MVNTGTVLLTLMLVVGTIGCSAGTEAGPTLTPATISDSDGDGWTDDQELGAGTDPSSKDTDADGYWDPQDPNPLDANIPGVAATPTTTPSPTPTPTATPTPTPTPKTLPVGWTLHATDTFEIGLPENWLAFELLPETIDAIIEEMASTNPEWIPFVEALKYQQGFDLYALDLEAPPTFTVTLSVWREVRLLSLDQHVARRKSEAESFGVTWVGDERFSLAGDEAALLEISMTAYHPSGDPFEVESQKVMVEHGGYYYVISIDYASEVADKYEELFPAILQTFTILR